MDTLKDHKIDLNKDLSTQSLAIVGLGCRFPGGANNPDAFWNNLLDGKDCIVDVPEGRWDVKRFYDENRNKPGKMHVKSGGFLQEKIDEFDALFFGISPREANSLDPQQRMLLEVSWEALEDAGIDPESLAGTSTGVFIGGFMMDNKLTQFSPLNRHTIASNTAVGMSLTMLSNRLSYTYDLRGPSISIDTACSSSMVALDQACRSILSGDSHVALVGGVNVMHRPEVFIAMSKGGFLSPDGRCKSFDERANGYGRGEGAGIVVVKPLRDAERDGDQIYAVIRATGCNQDGHTDGITVPNPDSQRTLIKKVSEKANVSLKDIQYFEAHGTGTAVGDPLEISAIGGTVGEAKSANETCMVGSVKGNIGHLEAASGIAAVIKSALCLKNKSIPPQANLINLNPNIPFKKLKVKIPRKVEPLQDDKGSIFTGINSFGYGGTNACAILESYQPLPIGKITTQIKQVENKRFILPLSSRSKPALQDMVTNYQRFIKENENLSINDLTYSAGTKRAHLSHRLTVSADSLADLSENLKQYSEQGVSLSCVETNSNEKRDKLAFVFTGMGPQWWGMGRDLMDSEPVFLASIKRSNQQFVKISGWSILEEMLKPEDESIISETQVAQTANFVLQVALVDLWASWGIKPSAIVGHSVGEVTTAYISGILSLEEALLVSYHRSRIQKKAAGQGAMLAVGLTETQSIELIGPYSDKVSIAAINSPSAITLAGDEKILNHLAEKLTSQDVFNRLLQVEVPYHSPLMDPLLDEVMSCLAKLKPANPTVVSYSTVTGEKIVGKSFDAQYWCQNVRQPVYFFKALEKMIDDGYEDFIEIGPHPVLSASIKACFITSKIDGFLAMSLKRKTNEQETIKRAVAELYGHGYQLDWAELSANKFIVDGQGKNKFTAIKGRFIRLPTYPWQRVRYWNDAPISLIDRVGQQIDFSALGTPQVGPDNAWLSEINTHFFEHLQDHKVEDLVILAGATYVEAGLALHREVTGSDRCLMTDLSLHNAMVIDSDNEPLMHTRYNEKDKYYTIQSYSAENPNECILHATGKIEPLILVNSHQLPIDQIKIRCLQEVEGHSIYQELNNRGLQYGPYFQGIAHIWRQDNEVLAYIKPHTALNLPVDNYQLHPTLLDACFQSLISAIPADGELSDQVYVPVKIGQLRHYKKISGAFYCHGTLSYSDSYEIIGDICLCDEQGGILVEICDLRCQSLRPANKKTIENLDEWTYQPIWKELATLSSENVNGDVQHYLLFIDESHSCQTLLNVFTSESNHHVTVVYEGDSFAKLSDRCYQVDGQDQLQLLQLFNENNDFSRLDKKVVYAWSMNNDAHDPIHLNATQTLLNLTLVMSKVNSNNEQRLYVLTKDAAKVVANDKVSGFHQSPLIGLGRVIAAELPNLQCTLIDVEQNLSKKSAQQLWLECQNNSSELELGYRGKQRFAYRLENVSLVDVYQPTYVQGDQSKVFSLAMQGVKGNEHCEFQRSEHPVLSENDVKLQIDSVYMQDHMMQPFASREVCARVLQVGSKVTGFTEGEEIIACYEGPLSNFVSIPETSLFAITKPQHWSVTASAGSLSAFSVAYTALVDVAHFNENSAILIIGSDSYIGQATLKLAEKQQCQTISVNHTDGKYRLNSASLGKDLLLAIQDQGFSGFDIIINTVGEQVNLPIDSLLVTHGHYIKTVVDNQYQVSLGATKSQLLLTSESILMGSETRVQKLLSKFSHGLLNNLEELSAKCIPVGNIASSTIAEQQPSCAQFSDIDNLQVINKNASSITIKLDASYLISGGFGGFGLSMAQWLVAQGAKSLVLVSRNGAASDEAKNVVDKFIKQGVDVKSAAIDISDKQSVQQLLTDVKETMHPLRGIFHAAGVLDDRELLALDANSLQKVMLPKALGAWNLHTLTNDLSLDCFVLYSSISAMIGNRNQGNYVAANLFLDNLAHYRQAQGLAACSINWGVLADVGMAANNPSVINHLAHVGIHAFSQQQALEAFSVLLQAPVAQLGIFNVDWQRWKQFEISSAHSRFCELICEDESQQQGDKWLNLLSQGEDELQPEVIVTLSALIAETLKLSAQQVDIQVPINKFGLDSLMAMDLQMKFRNEFRVDVSILELMKGNSIVKLSQAISQKLEQLADQEIEEDKVVVKEEANIVVNEIIDQMNQLSELSEEELDAMFARELETS